MTLGTGEFLFFDFTVNFFKKNNKIATRSVVARRRTRLCYAERYLPFILTGIPLFSLEFLKKPTHSLLPPMGQNPVVEGQ